MRVLAIPRFQLLQTNLGGPNASRRVGPSSLPLSRASCVWERITLSGFRSERSHNTLVRQIGSE